MITKVGPTCVPGCEFSIGTHNGIFHSDEVVGVAILDLATIDNETCVVRTRDPEELRRLKIVIDVGGGEFDHHIKGFNLRRPTGELYASAGLVWEKFGINAIKMVMTIEGLYQSGITKEDIQDVWKQIDKELIIPVDQEDNGATKEFHSFSFITTFLPAWFKETPDYDGAFKKAEIMSCELLRQAIKTKLVKIVTTKRLHKKFMELSDPNSLLSEGILEIPAQTMPWQEDVVAFNKMHHNAISFVIFPYPAGGWAAQCVPPSMEEQFQQLIPFPAEWAGLNEKTMLPAVCGVQGATFCHNGRFFARANTEYDIVKMCRIAIEVAKF